MKTPTIAIIGSFKQHHKELLAARRAFELGGTKVVFPAKSKIIKEGVDFVRLSSDDPKLSNAVVEDLALKKILAADCVFVIAPAGYVGRTVCYEIGRIMSLGRPIYFSSQPADLPIEVKKDHITTPAGLMRLMRRKDFDNGNRLPITLPEYQTYLAKVVRERGFEKETVDEVFMLLTEEVGELAKAIRKSAGRKTYQDSRHRDIEEEAADVLFMVLDLSNRLGIDLESSFQAKEDKNAKRKSA